MNFDELASQLTIDREISVDDKCWDSPHRTQYLRFLLSQ